jgi:mono/diheme cytochrome c family protein
MLFFIAALGGCAALAVGGPARTSAVAAQESKQVAAGRGHYMETCQLCHGEDGKRGAGFQTPIWGEGALIASKFGNAQALIDYMQLMPFNDPTLLDDDQKLAVVAFILANHGSIPRTGEVTNANAAKIEIK